MPHSKIFAIALRSGGPTVAGNAFRTDPQLTRFPASKHGKRPQFETPIRPAPATEGDQHFEKFVNYYVNLIGSKLALLNGLQFGLNDNNENDQAKQMSKQLRILAEALNIGSPKFKTNPKQLCWPLAGSYILLQDPSKTGFDSFTVDLFFECEPKFRFVTNCAILIHTADVNKTTLAPQSSSSSIIPIGSK